MRMRLEEALDLLGNDDMDIGSSSDEEDEPMAAGSDDDYEDLVVGIADNREMADEMYWEIEVSYYYYTYISTVLFQIAHTFNNKDHERCNNDGRKATVVRKRQ